MQKKTNRHESLSVHFARLAYALAQQVLPRYAPQKPPSRHPPPTRCLRPAQNRPQ